MKVIVYYYPGYSNDNNRMLDEWNIVLDAKPRDKNHLQPKIPSKGIYDQSSETKMRDDVELAIANGIDCFCFCYYTDGIIEVLQKPLQVFRKIIKDYPNFYYCVMWVSRWPHSKLPIMRYDECDYSKHEIFKDRKILVSKKQLIEIFNARICQFIEDRNYLTDMNGNPVVQIFSMSDLFILFNDELGGILSTIKQNAKAFLGNPLHLRGITHGLEHWVQFASKINLDSLTSYVLLPDFNSKRNIQNYEDCINRVQKEWQYIKNETQLDYYPSVSPGWDASPRGEYLEGFDYNKYPWSPIVIGNTPELFSELLNTASDFTFSNNNEKFIYVSSWNEWSEGHYIEPDIYWGDKFLIEILKAKNRINDKLNSLNNLKNK